MLLSEPGAAFGFSLESQSVAFLSGQQQCSVDSCLIPTVQYDNFVHLLFCTFLIIFSTSDFYVTVVRTVSCSNILLLPEIERHLIDSPIKTHPDAAMAS